MAPVISMPVADRPAVSRRRPTRFAGNPSNRNQQDTRARHTRSRAAPSFFEHGAARQLIAKGTQRLRKLIEVRSDEMVSGEVELLKPESGDLIQDRALIRNRIRQNDVEGGKTIADDEEQGIAEVENFAHFATAQFLNSRKFNVT